VNPLRIDVVVRGSRWVAECGAPLVTAVGASAEQAAENARLMALASFTRTTQPSMVLIRIEDPETSKILMQPMDEEISLEPSAGRRKWRYVASVKKSENAGRSS
jgi:hypothetical protein